MADTMLDFWQENSPFPSQTEAQWRELVSQTLGEAGFERRLVTDTLDGIKQQPIYTQAAQSAAPGDFPFRRGVSAEPQPWRICQSYSTADPATVNQQILAELEGGVNQIELALHADVNRAINASTLAEVEIALSGVLLDLIHVSLLPQTHNHQSAALLLALAKQRGHSTDSVSFAFNADPLSVLAITGKAILPAELPPMVTALAKHVDQHYSQSTSLCVDTRVYHNAGASAATQIGMALATGAEYLRALVSEGMSPAAAARQMVFRYALDCEFFESATSLRALRQLWAWMLSHSGVAEQDAGIQLEAHSGTRALSRCDPAVNMLRVSCQCFAAMIGGARGFNSAAFDSLLPPAADAGGSPLGRRVARNTQLILDEESGINRVQDPLGGAGHAEVMTDHLSAQAWKIMQDIEKQGGMTAAISNGHVAGLIEKNRNDRKQNIAVGKTRLTGVSEFPVLDEQLPAANESATQITNTASVKTGLPFQRDFIAPLMQKLQAGENTTALTWSAAKELTAPALTLFRDAEVFEQMRSRANAMQQRRDQPPSVILATIGETIAFSARVSFCQNFFAAAGIDCSVLSADALTAAKVTDRLLVICSSDRHYRSMAAGFCKSLKNKGAGIVWLAGRAGELQAQLTAAGLDGQIYVGCNRVQMLGDALQQLEQVQ